MEDERPPSAAAVAREFAQLAGLAFIAAALFSATHALAAANLRQREQDAAWWFVRGQRALTEAGRRDPIRAMRHAVVLAPAHLPYQLAYAAALQQGGRDHDALDVLARLHERVPEEPDVNLQLARLEARTGSAAAAIRSYQAALAVLWPEADRARREQVRWELIDFLLAQHQRARALSELLIVNADPPPAVADRIRLGQRLLAAGDATRAAARLREVLAAEPQQPVALATAGEAALVLGDYAQARDLLDRAPDDLPEVTRRRRIVHLVLDRDPLAPRLGAAARRRRLQANAADVLSALSTCPAAAAQLPDGAREQLEAWAGMNPPARRQPLRPLVISRDDAEDGLALVWDASRAIRRAACDPASEFDAAIDLIATRHGLGGGA